MNSLRGSRAGFGTPTLGANAYKRLGIRTTDISRNLFVPQTQGAVAYTGGKIVRSEFFGFWGQLAISESPDARQFFETLLEQLREIDIRQQAAGGTGASVSVNGIPQASIYNTIAFMLCTPGIRLDVDKLTLAYSAYADPARDPLRATDSTTLKNLMRLIAIRTQADQSDDHVLAPMVLSVLQVVPKDIRYLDWVRQPTTDESDIPANEHGFAYNYIMTTLAERGHEVIQKFLRAIYDKAHSLPQQAKMSLPNAEQSFLAIFHLTKVLLQSGTVPSSDFLDRGIKVFRQFTLWHQPYGKLAEHLVLLFKQEILNPGYNRRQLIFHESLVVDYGVTPSPGSAPTLYRHVKPIFYLHETTDLTALPQLNIVDPQSLQAQHLIRPQVTMIDPSAGQSPPGAILTQMFMNAFETIPQVKLKEDEVKAMQNLALEKLMPFMKRLRDLEEKSMTQVEDGTFSLADRDAAYATLKTDLLKIARQSPGPAMFQVPFMNDGQQQSAQVPLIEHIRVPVELKAKTGEHDGNSQPGYPAASMYDRMQQVLQAYAQDPSLKFDGAPDSPKLREVRFVLVGNDRLLQHVVTAYHLLQSNVPNVFHGLDVKFYLAPFAKNNLANFIAKNDLWYYRQIYNPFRSPHPYIIPFLRDDETEVRTNNENGLIGYATNFFRETMTQYVREAHHTFKTVIFKLEGRQDPTSSESADVIPFVQRVEIGIAPAVEEYKLKPGVVGTALKFEDVLKDKNFIYSPVDLAVKYLKLDLSNQPKPEVIDDPIPYQSITLSHVPRKGDLGTIPDPSSKGLELHAQPAPKIDKSRLRKNSLYFDPRQHLAEITCTSQVPFKVLADGVLHGPYRSVRISLAQNRSNGQIAQFPLQTFFPIQP